LVIARTRF